MSQDHVSRSEIAARDPGLYALLQRLAGKAQAVFFAGLPGTGKSLLVHQLAHLAHRAHRVVSLLQWDVARPAIERSAAGSAYPMADGVTHAAIRIAAGLWAREAVARWVRQTAPARRMLIGETPLVGHRFLELARPEPDEAEPFLRGPGCRFVIPVPSVEVRLAIERERARRIERPAHDREREDAPPNVLEAQWQDLARIAALPGVRPTGARAGKTRRASAPAPYDPTVYEHVYRFLLRHRRVNVIRMETVLPAGEISVYDFAIPSRDLMPTPQEATASIRRVEARFPDWRAMQAEVDRWYAM